MSMAYEFVTSTTMKEYNWGQWWIDRNYISPITVKAENVKEAIKQYAEIVNEKSGAEISGNALKNKQPIYRDQEDGTPRQVGYVITGSTLFQRDNGSWSNQYIDLWVTIKTIIETDFEEMEDCLA